MAFADVELFRNQQAFRTDAVRLAARGGLAGNGGVFHPVDDRLIVGTRMVRYCSATVPPRGPGRWWLLEKHYLMIEEQAKAYGVPTAALVREHCAVVSDWSDMTRRLTCVVKAQLRCYRGVGKPAFSRGTLEHDGLMAAELGIVQYFIPGLDDEALFRSAMLVLRDEAVDAAESLALM